MLNESPWEEQYRRVVRWFIRSVVCAKHPYESDVDKLKDYLYTFFENCWHLKEWLKHDETIKIDSKVIEVYAGRSGSAISLCGDVATVSKHLRVDDANRDKNAKLDEGMVYITSNLRKNGVVSTVGTGANILAKAGKLNALQVAENALEEWEEFFILNGLLDKGGLMNRINDRVEDEIKEINSQNESTFT